MLLVLLMQLPLLVRASQRSILKEIIMAQQYTTTAATADAIVVGSGLAGLTAALNLLDRGGNVVVIEKEAKMGGNSIKASSGINACVAALADGQQVVSQEEFNMFVEDTVKSAGDAANLELIQTLVQNSYPSLVWLKERVGVDLLQTRTRLGGHSRDRTHRPAKGAVGYTVMSAMQKTLEEYQQQDKLRLHLSTKVTELVCDEQGIIVGVEVVSNNNSSDQEASLFLQAPNVVLATGGFAADRGVDSFLAGVRPEYLQMSATFGDFSTGDGLKVANKLGAATRDMDKVQIHPTGFVDPADPHGKSKFLCAELMRGIGGILLNATGQRFCNELGNRAYVTDKMLDHAPEYKKTKQWDSSLKIPTFTLVLSANAAKQGEEHIGFYLWKKLLQPYKGLEELAKYMKVPKDSLQITLEEYRSKQSASTDIYQDDFGKTLFPGPFPYDLETEEFYAGQVTPVLHYCMGGLTTNRQGQVVDEKQQIIPGLYAAGEVVGGVHGNNRLAGNSLLECLVFGSIIGNSIPVQNAIDIDMSD